MDVNKGTNDYNIKSVIKSMEVFEILVEKGELSIGELSDLSGLGKSSVHRILGTLKHIGYVKQDIEDGKYYASIKVFELGNKIGDRIPFKNIVREKLEQLYEKCQETVNIGMLDDLDVVFLDKIITKEPLRIVLDVGRRVPAYCSGMGKILLAYTENVNLKAIEYKKYTENTLCNVDMLEEELKKIRQQGFSIDNEEYIRGLICIAVPVKKRNGDVIAAISVAVPAVRMNEPKKEEYLKMLQDTAYEMTKELPY
ncbi:Transcriptional regulator KdgR [bioreactor metagenome]|uniref:Transcriptional regulator KdgR n=1 Tax=bioreactor metagenome TaxID=1076179 RepID=A0A645C8X2_9ZZZZ|nr:IclR family transcriptional regulator [Lutispora sp.]MEA4962533.1 IclR family transcriptional regulator [Lutispora sp.]HCJ59064.1 IclR family transcriptional regulator [Clostridiaceae bacterium]